MSEMAGRYERPEGLVIWHGALWRAYDPIPVAPPVVSRYAKYIPEADKLGMVWRALVSPHSKAELMRLTHLTEDQTYAALVKLMKAGRVEKLRRRRGQIAYRRVEQE